MPAISEPIAPSQKTNDSLPKNAVPERADCRTDHQAAHLGRAVQAERPAVALPRDRVHQVAACRRVVRSGREAGHSA